MYEKALATNQRLKSRLETSKQELTMIQDQLQRAQVLYLHEYTLNVPRVKEVKETVAEEEMRKYIKVSLSHNLNHSDFSC